MTPYQFGSLSRALTDDDWGEEQVTYKTIGTQDSTGELVSGFADTELPGMGER